MGRRLDRQSLEVLPLSREHWVVRYAGDVHRCPSIGRSLRRADAINHARQFGEATIIVHRLDGEREEERVNPDFIAPTPADVKGPHAQA